MQILRAEAQRQMSMLRQEVAVDLLGILSQSREAPARQRIIKLTEAHLRAGITAAERAEHLWPDVDGVKTAIEGEEETKPAAAKKHLRVFDQMDRVHQRSLSLLHESFEHIRVILDRVQPMEPSPVPKSSGPA
jgi:hypothetical protein